jgi:hypothetical protein
VFVFFNYCSSCSYEFNNEDKVSFNGVCILPLILETELERSRNENERANADGVFGTLVRWPVNGVDGTEVRVPIDGVPGSDGTLERET